MHPYIIPVANYLCNILTNCGVLLHNDLLGCNAIIVILAHPTMPCIHLILKHFQVLPATLTPCINTYILHNNVHPLAWKSSDQGSAHTGQQWFKVISASKNRPVPS